MSDSSQGDSLNSGGGNMNVAKDGGTAIQNNYYGSTAQQNGSASSIPAGKTIEEIEHLLAQNKVQEAIERLRSVPEHRRAAINFSRRRHAIQDKQHKQLLTDEQAETEVNKIVDAMLEMCTGSQSAEGSRQEAVASTRTSSSERDYFEHVGGNVYTAPVTIHQHGPEADSAPVSTKQRAEQQPTISLRSEPLEVSFAEYKQVFKLDTIRWRPLEYIRNDYEARGDVVFDRATGLTWQQSSSEKTMYYEDALQYVEDLNRSTFAGYADWRLPTIPELMSLLEPKEKNGDRYIDPVFDSAQWLCLSADRRIKGECPPSAWSVNFLGGSVPVGTLQVLSSVRCVRS